ncbi:hypothetical protein [Mucilaginibacter sp. OK098]|uniref:hypothetical protein n=1 Tax=Mucilaginibacter sp. OK098 TaxID=1855297 RepID=UPI00091A7D47|nr:hypothetical protein [Mucilaginibacter sp. OK098]SHN23327.1 hypothetical protein SAMN05216524_10734 [Mucilaginibacter sp. OK098]
MKLFTMSCLFLLMVCHPPAQQTKLPEPKKDSVLHISAAQYDKNQNTIAMLKSDKKAFTCKLSSPELQKRKSTVIAKLKNMIVEKVELNNGFSYKFKNSDATIDLLADFIKTERQCCDFFNFSMFVSRNQYILMDISGQKGIKTFIHDEIGL